jgi:RNA polymerase sigma factor for flagellar operon FliA
MVATECGRQVQDAVGAPRRRARATTHGRPLPIVPSAFTARGCAGRRLHTGREPLSVTASAAAWLAPRPTTGAHALEALILKHSDLVRRIAYHFVRRIPSHVELDDLIQAGMVGLVEAARRYGPCAIASFATFAGFRIRGAMLDFLRTTDWRPRLLHRRVRDIEAATRSIQNQTGEIPRPAGVAHALGISLESYHRTLQDAADSKLLSLDYPDPEETGLNAAATVDDSANPADGMEREDLQRAVSAAIASLPENEKAVLLLYYKDERRLREIGEQLDISESRVCQIRKRAVERVRSIIERRLTADRAVDGFAPGDGT